MSHNTEAMLWILVCFLWLLFCHGVWKTRGPRTQHLILTLAGLQLAKCSWASYLNDLMSSSFSWEVWVVLSKFTCDISMMLFPLSLPPPFSLSLCNLPTSPLRLSLLSCLHSEIDEVRWPKFSLHSRKLERTRPVWAGCHEKGEDKKLFLWWWRENQGTSAKTSKRSPESTCIRNRGEEPLCSWIEQKALNQKIVQGEETEQDWWGQRRHLTLRLGKLSTQPHRHPTTQSRSN